MIRPLFPVAWALVALVAAHAALRLPSPDACVRCSFPQEAMPILHL